MEEQYKFFFKIFFLLQDPITKEYWLLQELNIQFNLFLLLASILKIMFLFFLLNHFNLIFFYRLKNLFNQ